MDRSFSGGHVIAIGSPGGSLVSGPVSQDAGAKAIPLTKRVFDKTAAAAGLVFFAPFLLITALAIAVTDGVPVIFAHERVGRGGRIFRCFKFRTMSRDSEAILAALIANDPAAKEEWETNRKLKSDPRVTCLGAILRKTSLDELPQLWNVLKGDMSIVGPRPIVVEECHHYREHIQEYLSVLPGITGAWQSHGRSNTTYDERVALDVAYVRNWTFSKDIAIILRTIKVVLGSDGAR
jgi:exopolysaccharide production protein ExoY